MKTHPVVFITVMDYDNLGVGYMASFLSDRGFNRKIFDCNMSKPDLLRVFLRTSILCYIGVFSDLS